MARGSNEVRSVTCRSLEAAEIVIVGGLVLGAALTALYTVIRWVIG